ncbi:MAG: glycerol-3-phosphate 1-O-acyltransferase PlsY [Verrucomicrobiota bacterium]
MEIFSDILCYALTALAAYLLGSIPTGYLVAKAKGIDIRSVGSGNIGATNVFRILGKPAGIFVLLADAAKGFCACWLIPGLVLKLSNGNIGSRLELEIYFKILEQLAIVAGIAAILGHNYTCWLKFKGGKGIATTAGVMIALAPWAFLIVLTIFLLVAFGTRYVSLGAILASFCLPFSVWICRGTKTMIGVMAALGALAIYKHKANIKRLLNGTESRMGQKKKTEVAK